MAHAMEDCFVAAQQARITLRQKHIDRLLEATDLLVRIGDMPEAEHRTGTDEAPGVDVCLSELARVLDDRESTPIAAPIRRRDRRTCRLSPAAVAEPVARSQPAAPVPGARRDNSDRVLRVSAENLNRLLGLAGESLVESRSVKPFADSLLRLKRMQQQLSATLDGLRHLPPSPARDEQMRERAGRRRCSRPRSVSSSCRSGSTSSRCSIAARSTWRIACTTERSPAA